MRVHLTRNESSRPRAVLYDHDGTLVDSLAVVVAATNAVMHARQLPERPAAEIIKAMVLSTGPRMGFHSGIADPAIQLAMGSEFYAAAIVLRGRVRVYDGVVETVAAVAARGLPQGVISNNQGTFIRAAMQHLGIAGSFQPAAVLGEEDVPAPKPSPSGLLLAAERLGLPPAACLFVGDGPPDAQAATAAGMRAIGVTWGIHRRSEMADMGFAVLIDHPRELLDLL